MYNETAREGDLKVNSCTAVTYYNTLVLISKRTGNYLRVVAKVVICAKFRMCWLFSIVDIIFVIVISSFRLVEVFLLPFFATGSNLVNKRCS